MAQGLLLVIATMFLLASSPKTVVGLDRWCTERGYVPAMTSYMYTIDCQMPYGDDATGS